MPDAKLRTAIALYPEHRTLIVNLADRSGQFHALCEDLHAVTVQLAKVVRDDDKLEYRRLHAELALELSEWLGRKRTG
jgi:hypothetical protein